LHEMSLMSEVFEIINQTVETNNIRQVKKVNLQVGRLANVAPDSLSFIFGILAQGTKCQGACLMVEEMPVTANCLTCDQEFHGEGFPLICPACGSRETYITGGTEFRVASLEVDEEVKSNN